MNAIILEAYFDKIATFACANIAPISFLPILALIIAYRNYRRKSGIEIRSIYSVKSSRNCTFPYINSVTLENMKDRPYTIYAIYLRVGRNIYLKVEDFEESPLIIKPFETWTKKYGPVDHYVSELTKIDLQQIWDHRANQIVLSTHIGAYIAKKRIKKWSPSKFTLKNSTIQFIYPTQFNYGKRSFGDQVRYVVVLEHAGSNDEIVEITANASKMQIFEKFIIEESALEKTQKLEEFLNYHKSIGDINCNNIKVIDLDEFRENQISSKIGYTISPNHANAFQYHIIGRLKHYEMKIHKLKRKIFH